MGQLDAKTRTLGTHCFFFYVGYRSASSDYPNPSENPIRYHLRFDRVVVSRMSWCGGSDTRTGGLRSFQGTTALWLIGEVAGLLVPGLTFFQAG
jgi:hypothetical protein